MPASASLRKQYADYLDPERQAEIDFDARPKDEHNYLTEVSKERVRQLKGEHKDKRKAEGRPAKIVADPIGHERKCDLLAEAYRNKVAGDEFAKRGNNPQANEFFALEKNLLERALEIT